MTGQANPRFSIVVAVLNGAATIGACLRSIQDQTNSDREVLIVDGGSTDGTMAIVDQFGDLVRWSESAPDRGICHAWNKALPHLSGDWVLFLGADDELATVDVLQRAAAQLSAIDAQTSVAYGRVEIMGPDGRVARTVGEPWAESRDSFLWRNTIPHQGVFHRRDLFGRIGGFDERFRICGDYELLLRELRRRPPVFLEDMIVARMGGGGLSNRASSGLRATREFHWARRANGLTRLPDVMAPRIWRAVLYEAIRRTLGQGAARSVAGVYQAAVARRRA